MFIIFLLAMLLPEALPAQNCRGGVPDRFKRFQCDGEPYNCRLPGRCSTADDFCQSTDIPTEAYVMTFLESYDPDNTFPGKKYCVCWDKAYRFNCSDVECPQDGAHCRYCDGLCPYATSAYYNKESQHCQCSPYQDSTPATECAECGDVMKGDDVNKIRCEKGDRYCFNRPDGGSAFAQWGVQTINCQCDPCPNFKNSTCVNEPGECKNGSFIVKPNCTWVEIPITPGIVRNLTFEFRVDVKPTLDFLMLFDSSSSFKDDIAFLRTISPEIIEKVQSLAPHAQIGFSTFIDRAPERGSPSLCIPNNPCPLYRFRNNFPMSNDQQKLKEIQNKIEFPSLTGYNPDGPEDVLTGLHQAVTCPDEIGWRENARKMILLATDDAFKKTYTDEDSKKDFDHTKCYLGGTGLEQNTFWGFEYKFPNDKKVADALFDRRIVVVFALAEPYGLQFRSFPKLVDFYKPFSNAMKTATAFVQLESGSANLMDIIEKKYVEVFDKLPTPLIVKLEGDIPADILQIDGKPFTPGKRIECDPLADMKTNCFLSVLLVKCPPNGVRKFTLFFNIQGIEDKLQVDFSVLC